MGIMKRILNWLNSEPVELGVLPNDAPKPALIPAYVEPTKDWYEAKLLQLIDGDTVELMVKLSHDTYQAMRVRFYGVAVDESSTVKGGQVLLSTMNWFQNAGSNEPLPLVLRWVKHDKYGGRIDGVVFRKIDKTSINQYLLDNVLGVPTDKYGRKI